MEESTKDENKRGDSPQNDQQELETGKFLEKISPNSIGNRGNEEESGEGGKRDEDAVSGDNVTREQGDKVVKIEDNPLCGQSRALSQREFESQLLQEVARLLSAPAWPEDLDEEEKENDMSRLGQKIKAPNKSISRPSLSHVNSKIPGELSGQPSVKSTKEDVKYWKTREQELLDRIAALESKAAAAEAAKDRSQQPPSAQTQKQEKPEDLPSEQSKETNLKSLKNPDEIISHLKAQNEDLRGALAKMTAILRDKTALCVSQEKKVAALANQVESLKEVVAITKDLLNIRNMEVQHISNDIQAMETKIDCERQRHNQMLIKMDEAVKLNSELKKEYENQMKLFQQLRDSYEEKIRMISQNGYPEENKDTGNDQQRSSPGNAKSTQIAAGKTPRSSNYKVNFQDTTILGGPTSEEGNIQRSSSEGSAEEGKDKRVEVSKSNEDRTLD